MPTPETDQFSTQTANSAATIPNTDSYVSAKPRLPEFLNTVNIKYVKLGYGYLIGHGFHLVIPPIAAAILAAGVRRQPLVSCGFSEAVMLVGILGFFLYICVGFMPRSTYLVDFACYRPPNEFKVSREEFIDLAKKSGEFSAKAIEFQQRVLSNSGIGDETYMPPTVFKPKYNITLRDGREEAAMAMFGAINDLFAQTRLRPTDIKILVVNCGVLNTTPSLSSMVINHFKMRSDIQSFNLGGMGCAAGLVAVDLANDLLSAWPGSYAVVVSTEAVTFTWYKGDDCDMLLPNCFFRMGAAALLLSDCRRQRWRAKYELKQLVRIHKGMDDASFQSIRLREDARGRQGVSVGQDAIEVGAHALRDNIAALASLLHTSLSQRLHSLTNLFSFTANNTKTPSNSFPLPNGAGLAFEHVCVLAASKKVLDEVKSRLGIEEEFMEASRRTLERFGNTSSSSIWYQLAYLEAHGMVNARDRIWQIAFGSGFKCNTAVLKALRTPVAPRLSPWFDY